jgi:hypothetical protein
LPGTYVISAVVPIVAVAVIDTPFTPGNNGTRTYASRTRIILGTRIPVIARTNVVGVHTYPGGALVVGTHVAIVSADRPVHLVIIQAHSCPIAGIRVSAVIIERITTGRPGGKIGMGTHARRADVIGAVVTITRARRAIGFVVVQARARTVAGIRVCAVIIRGVTARRSSAQARMGADAGVADIIGAVVTVIGAGCAVGFVIVETGTGPIASIGVRAVIVCRVSAGRTSRKGGVRTDTRCTYITCAIAAVIGTNGAVAFMIPQASTCAVAGIGVRAIVIRGVATGRSSG